MLEDTHLPAVEPPRACALVLLLEGGNPHAPGAATVEDRTGARERAEKPDGEVGGRERLVVGDAEDAVREVEAVDALLGRTGASSTPAVEVGTDERPRPAVHVLDGARRECEVAEQAVGSELGDALVPVPEPSGDRLVVLEADRLVLGGDACGRIGTPLARRLGEVERDTRLEQPLLGTAEPREVRRAEEPRRHQRLEPGSPDERCGGPAQRLDVA